MNKCKIKKESDEARSQKKELEEKLRKQEQLLKELEEKLLKQEPRLLSKMECELEWKQQELHSQTAEKKKLESDLKEARSRISNYELAAQHQGQFQQMAHKGKIVHLEKELLSHKRKIAKLEESKKHMRIRMEQLESELQDKESEISQMKEENSRNDSIQVCLIIAYQDHFISHAVIYVGG